MRAPRTSRTIRQLHEAAAELAAWAKWEAESLSDFHDYAQRFGGSPGSSVYEFVLRDALRFRGLTLEQFRKDRR